MTFEEYEKIVDIVLDAADERDPVRAFLSALMELYPALQEAWDEKYERMNCHPE